MFLCLIFQAYTWSNSLEDYSVHGDNPPDRRLSLFITPKVLSAKHNGTRIPHAVVAPFL